jgi:hypothetical protein
MEFNLILIMLQNTMVEDSVYHKKDYHRYVHNSGLYNSKPSISGYIFYNKLPKNIK